MNRWKIPLVVEREVIARDLVCAYCSTPFSGKNGPYRSRASWEHVINDLALVSADNIVLCCVGCNASKGARPLERWLESKYCKDRGITAESVSPVVRAVLFTEPATPEAVPNNSSKPTLLRCGKALAPKSVPELCLHYAPRLNSGVSAHTGKQPRFLNWSRRTCPNLVVAAIDVALTAIFKSVFAVIGHVSFGDRRAAR